MPWNSDSRVIEHVMCGWCLPVEFRALVSATVIPDLFAMPASSCLRFHADGGAAPSI